MAYTGNITFTCEEPDSLAEFWVKVLGYELESIPPEFADAIASAGHDPGDARAIVDPAGDGPRLYFK